MSLDIWLPDERLISWNRIMRMNRWDQNAEKNRVHMLMREALARSLGPNPGDWPMFDGVPVVIELRAWTKGKRIDLSNVALKFYEDALKGTIIRDDHPLYVQQLIIGPNERADKRHRPGVRIRIEEAS